MMDCVMDDVVAIHDEPARRRDCGIPKTGTAASYWYLKQAMLSGCVIN